MLEIRAYPPNFQAIISKFPVVASMKNVVFTYGKVIYNPHGGVIDGPLSLHEATHSLQQDKMGPKKWWMRYLTDDEFRLDQELEAYQNQYRRFCEIHKDRNRQAVFLNRIASDLASQQYGGIITLLEARQRIRNFLS